MENSNTSKAGLSNGLGLLRKANILAMVSIVLTIVGGIILVVGTAMGIVEAVGEELSLSSGLMIMAGAGGLSALIGVIFVLIAGIMEIVALIKISRIHEGYRNALLLVIAGLILPFIVSLTPIPTTISGILHSAISVLSVCCVIGATDALLRDRGETAIADKGMGVRKLYIICTIIMVVVDLAGMIPEMTTAIGLIAMVTGVVQLVAVFKYMGFLGHASKFFA